MIKVLEKAVADKIAAGEIIDRPVSIVKELVENSIDAEASNITVEIRQGGKTYIRVTDDGCGIDADNVETAFKRHATSKISVESDLSSIGTLGFRGEALASICAVSATKTLTRTHNSRLGRKVCLEASKLIEDVSCGCPEGTTVIVTDLFFNLPARKKFLGTDGAESRRITDITSRLALSYPDIKFRLINNGKTVFATNGNGNIYQNILNIFGDEGNKDLIKLNASTGNYHIRGFISNPGKSLPTRSKQFFCVNGRIVNSKSIEISLDRGYKERLFAGRFPIAYIFLTLPIDQVDVNIHPAKKEVRFEDEIEIEDFITKSVSDALKTIDAIPAMDVMRSNNIPESLDEESEDSKQVDVKTLLQSLRVEEEYLRGFDKTLEGDLPADHVSSSPFNIEQLSICGSIFNTYILAQDENSFYMIDQHAAHERILYEKLLEQLKATEKLSQNLLPPVTCNVSADIVTIEDEWIYYLRNLGYEIEFFGNNAYIVRSIPAFMNPEESWDFLHSVFAEFRDCNDLHDTKLLDNITIKSCKSAVKGGDILSDTEILALIDQLKKCKNPFSCPHGRPVFIRMSRYEIEKMFKRV